MTQKNTRFFRLIPIETDNREWECSIIKEELIVEAESEEDARKKAAYLTKIAVEKSCEDLITGPFTGPWDKEELVRAEEISKIPDGFPKERIIYKSDPIDKFD